MAWILIGGALLAGPGCQKSDSARTALFKEFDATLQPGAWEGYTLGPSSDPGVFVAKVSPQESSHDGASLEKQVVQPEYGKQGWIDVLRLQIPASARPLKVHVRVYRTGP